MEKTCNGKKSYNKKDAVSAMNYILREGREDFLRVYQCGFCSRWHLTKQEDWFKKKRG